MFQVILAEAVESGLVAEESVLITSEQADAIDNKHISTLNMTEIRETTIVEKHHGLCEQWSETITYMYQE